MRRFVTEGMLPYPNSVRIEEYLNYFTFDYPDPSDGNEVALNAEVGPCPWMPQHLRVSCRCLGVDEFR